MKLAKIDVIYFGGYHPEAGLIIRQAREQGLKADLISGDALVDKQFWQVAGPAGEGVMMTFDADPRKNPGAKDLVAKFKAANYDPEGYTLYTYAAIQTYAQAAEKAKSTKLAAVGGALHSTKFNTVLGEIEFDAKGDTKKPSYRVYVWKNGAYDYVN